MCAMLIMEERDFTIPISNLSNAELHGQISWYRSWSSSSGCRNLDDLQLSEEMKTAVLDDSIADCCAKMKPMWDVLEILLGTHQHLTKAFEEGTTDLPEAMTELTIDCDKGEELPCLFKQVKPNEEATKTIQAQMVAAGKACQQQQLLLEPYQFQVEYLREQRAVAWGILGKIIRMKSLNEEFEARNKAAAVIASCDAISSGKPSTYKEPVIPVYLHSNIVFGGQDFMVAEDFMPGLGAGQVNDFMLGFGGEDQGFSW